MSTDPSPRDIWAIVVNWNNAEVTAGCVESLTDSGVKSLTIAVVDNGSTDGSRDDLARRFADLENVVLLEAPGNLGYSGGNAFGMCEALARGAWAVLVINNDVLARPGFLEPLVSSLEKRLDVGAAGPVQVNLAGDEIEWVNAGSRFSLWTGRVDPDGPSGTAIPPPGSEPEVGFVCGACTLFRSDALRDVGPFDWRLFLGTEEPDWAIRARAHDWKIVTVTDSVIEHPGAVSTSKVPAATSYFYARNPLWLIRRHGSPVQAVIGALRTILWSGPKTVLGHLARRDTARARGTFAGFRDGLTADCHRGTGSSDSLAEHVFELANQ